MACQQVVHTGAAANGSSVSFINGETSKLVTVTAVNDTLVEGTELVTMTLANGNGYTIETGRASINIADDDQPDYVITHWLTIYDANLTGQSIYDIHPGERDGAFFAGEKAPTSTVNTMEEIADKLVAVLGDKATANIELKARTKQVKDSKRVLFRDVDELKSDAIKAKKRFLQVATAEATSGERTAGYFMWGQTIDLPNYNGTFIQQIEYTDTIYIKGAAKPRVDKTQILVEGFFLKGGRTNLDLHDVAIDFKNADMDKIERVYKITLGAGTYNGKGVEKFEILEPKHDGPLEGVVAWAGATTEIVVKLMLSSSETPRATYSGPWGN